MIPVDRLIEKAISCRRVLQPRQVGDRRRKPVDLGKRIVPDKRKPGL
jgi:hypothetical protein